MAYKTCPDCGCRIFEYGCVNCNEMDYISMQDDGESSLSKEMKKYEREKKESNEEALPKTETK